VTVRLSRSGTLARIQSQQLAQEIVHWVWELAGYGRVHALAKRTPVHLTVAIEVHCNVRARLIGLGENPALQFIFSEIIVFK